MALAKSSIAIHQSHSQSDLQIPTSRLLPFDTNCPGFQKKISTKTREYSDMNFFSFHF